MKVYRNNLAQAEGPSQLGVADCKFHVSQILALQTDLFLFPWQF